MQKIWFLPLLLFVGVAIVAAGMMKRSLRELTPDDKAKLVDIVSGTSSVWFALTAAVFVGWFAIVFLRPWLAPEASVVVMVAVLALTVASAISTRARYVRAALPDAFVRAFVITRTMRTIAAMILFASLVAMLFARRRGVALLLLLFDQAASSVGATMEHECRVSFTVVAVHHRHYAAPRSRSCEAVSSAFRFGRTKMKV